ncbi:MAG: dihydroorotase [Ignavibacteria bacterium]|nr:dihydroorotase [Ignavibacteria bacterium]
MNLALHSPLDMHLHLRQDEMLDAVAPLSAKYFAGGVVMPNLIPPINSIERLLWYKAEVKRATAPYVFEPYMTLFFRSYTFSELEEARRNIIGVKLYPSGITTNSEGGVQDLSLIEPTLSMMQELDIPLLVHGETNGFVMDRESEFCRIYQLLASKFPGLRIVMEHITTRDAVVLLDRYENLFATITPHHLLTTLDDVVGGLMNPHLFCKPIAKRPEDRDALLAAALSAHSKVMMGTDSAPHPTNMKESHGCAAGVFSAPIALPLLAELFERHNALDRLQAFVSSNACRIYRITPREKEVRLIKQSMIIPASYLSIVPMWAGYEISWSFEA